MDEMAQTRALITPPGRSAHYFRPCPPILPGFKDNESHLPEPFMQEDGSRSV